METPGPAAAAIEPITIKVALGEKMYETTYPAPGAGNVKEGLAQPFSSVSPHLRGPSSDAQVPRRPFLVNDRKFECEI